MMWCAYQHGAEVPYGRQLAITVMFILWCAPPHMNVSSVVRETHHDPSVAFRVTLFVTLFVLSVASACVAVLL